MVVGAVASLMLASVAVLVGFATMGIVTAVQWIER